MASLKLLYSRGRGRAEHVRSVDNEIVPAELALGVREEGTQILEGATSHENARLARGRPALGLDGVHSH